MKPLSERVARRYLEASGPSLFHWLDARAFKVPSTVAATLQNFVTDVTPLLGKLDALVNNFRGGSFESGSLFNKEEAEILEEAVKILKRTANLLPLVEVEESVRKVKRLPK